MKKKMFAIAPFLLFFVVCFAPISDINGKWTGVLNLPDSSTFQLNYTFKVDSGKLTGTAHMPQCDANITDGMINGNDFSFNVPVPDGNAPHTGKIYPDSIKLHIVYKGQHLSAILKRGN
ncbi:hypothetical protein SNE25_10890 [Mucilaginibacter sabulilitoris]|uniref:Glycoside hydrolase n=1 Tax=Mucilaginibacter sabulilitoris TaxID=1173583 RepID=A0ABZ0TY17_9SPHI|nr:hypothetical protein [Mucilaginibacter sabulilitoris]WPU96025.1 hypothetical protein SNE25_10890 [Mucilaginibacter sabulilitoris]